MRLPFKVDDAHEFKPILAEIEDAPFNPLSRAVFWLTFTTVVFFGVWSIVGEIDVVVTGPGKVIPSGHAKLIQPLDSGVVSKILVNEGDRVRKGQPLIEIDPSMTADELEASDRNYRHTRLEIRRIESSLTGGAFNASGSNDGELAAQAQLYESSRQSLSNELHSKREELNKSIEQQKQTDAELAKNQQLLEIALKKRDRLKPVIDIIPRDEWDKNESDVSNYTSSIEQNKHRLDELSHDQEHLKADLEKIDADFRKNNLQELSQKQKDATDLSSKVRELRFKHSKQRLVSPVDGYIDTLYVHTVGGVVSPGEKLMSIVPTQSPVVIDASISNRDIGFIATDMAVQIKADAFDFQKYGMYQGKVKLISKDSHDDEKKQPGEQQAVEKKLEQVYEVYIEPTTKYLKVDGKDQPLLPGMTVSAEIKVGRRRIIEFFIYPLIKYWHEGISIK